MSIVDFFKGMGSISIFPPQREIEPFVFEPRILSDQEAFQKDLQQVGDDMWSAIGIVEKEIKNKKKKYKK